MQSIAGGVERGERGVEASARVGGAQRADVLHADARVDGDHALAVALLVGALDAAAVFVHGKLHAPRAPRGAPPSGLARSGAWRCTPWNLRHRSARSDEVGTGKGSCGGAALVSRAGGGGGGGADGGQPCWHCGTCLSPHARGAVFVANAIDIGSEPPGAHKWVLSVAAGKVEWARMDVISRGTRAHLSVAA
eukprot:CAMPEP_0184377056 /NCGR_PEP_ID=MMETSP0007-20130409/1944_1 /TAXON_ID=97485 /ORGANISM="Prymnesium parvum, Strain Texoma1" /LENGTH=191 /DNA_ID=CAMNT_0026720809 /DNA_START=454 /DNA_END=1028 /DNA_ORIENTATION=+